MTFPVSPFRFCAQFLLPGVNRNRTTRLYRIFEMGNGLYLNTSADLFWRANGHKCRHLKGAVFGQGRTDENTIGCDQVDRREMFCPNLMNPKAQCVVLADSRFSCVPHLADEKGNLIAATPDKLGFEARTLKESSAQEYFAYLAEMHAVPTVSSFKVRPELVYPAIIDFKPVRECLGISPARAGVLPSPKP